MRSGAPGREAGRDDLEGHLVLPQLAKTVHDALPIIGNDGASKFAVLVVLFSLVEDDPVRVPEDSRVES